MPSPTSSTPKKPQAPKPDNSGLNIEIVVLGDEEREQDKILACSASSDRAQQTEITLDIEYGSDSISCESSDDISRCITVHQQVLNFITQHSSLLKKILIGVAYFSYFMVAIVFDTIHFCPYEHSVVPLVILTGICLSLFVTSRIWAMFGGIIQEKIRKPVHKSINQRWNIIRWFVVLLPLFGIIAIVMSTVWNDPKNLASLAGISFFIILLLALSSAPTRVNWRPVVGGFVLQFYFATLILKWDAGYSFFKFLGRETNKFLSYTDVGSNFVFGNKSGDHFFVMQILPVVVFFSCVITVLYHLGVMQCIISKIAFIMRLTLGTTAAESLCAAGNIFVGQTSAPILVRPFLAIMTKSELHAVMVGGFATIAGGVLATYIKFGIPAEHLMCASVINAPCSLAVSKLLRPDTEQSQISEVRAIVDNTKQQYRNLLEAAAAGASQSIALVANIAANLIAFLALLAFVNATIAWVGAFVCLPNLSFEGICHYLLMPVVYLMGVRWEDAGQVAELIALKTFLNEFVAYEKLSELIDNRITCSTDGHILSPRSEIIATYALCGFANLGSVGVTLGGLGPMAPQRIRDMASIVVSALFGGVIVSLLTASVAGLLVTETPTHMVCSETLTTTVMDSLLQNSTAGITTIIASTVNANV